jgi:hypothetical protein
MKRPVFPYQPLLQGQTRLHFFVANMRENIGPLSDKMTSKCGEVLLFP